VRNRYPGQNRSAYCGQCSGYAPRFGAPSYVPVPAQAARRRTPPRHAIGRDEIYPPTQILQVFATGCS
jgi:hypothetical protein